jgi:hypothetical protein
VKVNRPDVKVQSRSGYFALPPDTESPIQPYEIPMLVALNSGEIHRDFDHRSRILRFADDDDGTRFIFVVEVPLNTFHYVEDNQESNYTTRFSILGLLKNQDGRIVRRFTQDYPLQGPLDKVDMVKSGSVVFMRETDLSAGTYTYETAVVDQLSQKSSTRKTRLIVEDNTSSLRMSSLTVVRRVDPVDQQEVPGEPLIYQDGRIVPNLGGAILKSQDSGVGVYCVIYPSSEDETLPELILDLMKDGELIARGKPELPNQNEKGSIKFAGTVPINNLVPGRYELRAFVIQGQSAVKEHAFFSISELNPSDPVDGS